MGYAANYRSGYLGGYLSEDASPFDRVSAPSGRPELVFEIAFESFGEELTWRDESAYVAGVSPGFSTNRGRSGELDEFNTGTFSILLRNEDGRFDPANPSGPYFGKLVPRRQVRVGVKIGSGARPFTFKRSAVGGDDAIRGYQDARPITIFRGESGSFDRAWGPEGRSATVALDAVEHLQRLDEDVPKARDPVTNEQIPITVSGFVGDAMVQLLATLGWPGAEGTTAPLRNEFVDIDRSDVELVDYATQPAPGVPIEGTYLSALRTLAATDGGDFYISREGRVTFRSKTSQGAIGGTWGDSPGLLPYANVRGRPADELLINEVTVHQSNGAETTASDTESVAAYGRQPRTWNVYARLFPDELTATLLAKYAQPRERIVGFAPLGRRNVAFWRSILPRDFGDRIRFVLNPVYGEQVDQTLRLEGISISSPDGHDWRVDWSASELIETFPNLLPNAVGDFEPPEGSTTPENDWVGETGTLLGGTKAMEGPGADPRAPHGDYVLQLRTDATLPQVPLNAYADVDISALDPTIVLPGATFRIGGYFQSRNSSAGATFRVEWLNALDAVVGEDVVDVPTSFNRYLYATFETTCPLSGVRARLRYQSAGLVNEIRADALFLRRI